MQRKLNKLKSGRASSDERVRAAEAMAADMENRYKRLNMEQEARMREQHSRDVEDIERKLHNTYEAMVKSKVRDCRGSPSRVLATSRIILLCCYRYSEHSP